MIEIKNESAKHIDPERLPKSIRKYAWMIEDFEKSNEWVGDNEWWCYLIDGIEVEPGLGTIHDTLSIIRMELKDLERRYGGNRND